MREPWMLLSCRAINSDVPFLSAGYRRAESFPRRRWRRSLPAFLFLTEPTPCIILFSRFRVPPSDLPSLVSQRTPFEPSFFRFLHSPAALLQSSLYLRRGSRIPRWKRHRISKWNSKLILSQRMLWISIRYGNRVLFSCWELAIQSSGYPDERKYLLHRLPQTGHISQASDGCVSCLRQFTILSVKNWAESGQLSGEACKRIEDSHTLLK